MRAAEAADVVVAVVGDRIELVGEGRSTATLELIGAQNALESDWFSVLNSAEQAQLQDMLERVLTRIDRPAETPAAD